MRETQYGEWRIWKPALGMITSMSQLMTSLAAAALGYTQGLGTIMFLPPRIMGLEYMEGLARTS
jgi:hypothetical protein